MLKFLKHNYSFELSKTLIPKLKVVLFDQGFDKQLLSMISFQKNYAEVVRCPYPDSAISEQIVTFHDTQSTLHSPTLPPPNFLEKLQSPGLSRTRTVHRTHNVKTVRLKPEESRVPIELFLRISVSKLKISTNTMPKF